MLGDRTGLCNCMQYYLVSVRYQLNISPFTLLYSYCTNDHKIWSPLACGGPPGGPFRPRCGVCITCFRPIKGALPHTILPQFGTPKTSVVPVSYRTCTLPRTIFQQFGTQKTLVVLVSYTTCTLHHFQAARHPPTNVGGAVSYITCSLRTLGSQLHLTYCCSYNQSRTTFLQKSVYVLCKGLQPFIVYSSTCSTHRALQPSSIWMDVCFRLSYKRQLYRSTSCRVL